MSLCDLGNIIKKWRFKEIVRLQQFLSGFDVVGVYIRIKIVWLLD